MENLKTWEQIAQAIVELQSGFLTLGTDLTETKKKVASHEDSIYMLKHNQATLITNITKVLEQLKTIESKMTSLIK